MKPMKLRLLAAAVLSVLLTPAAFALGNGFTYQGSLVDTGSPAGGLYDLQFVLQTTGGTPVGPVLVKDDVAVSDGVFSVELDFGPVIATDNYQLQIGVRPGASNGAFTGLSPATKITPTPQAQIAAVALVATSVANGAIGAAQINPTQVQARVASSCPSGQSIRVVNANGSVTCEAAGLGPVGPQGPVGPIGLTGSAGATGPIGPTGAAGSADAWGRLGNAGTNGFNFIGTTDAEPLIFRANNLFVGTFTARGTESAWGNAPSIELGSGGNLASAVGATVSGGGASRSESGVPNAGLRNSALSRFATVGGGAANTGDGSYSTVGGGLANTASGFTSTVGGGELNHASGVYSTVVGGVENIATGLASTVGGGVSNCAGGDRSWAGGSFATIRAGNEAGDGTCEISSGDSNGDEGTFVWSGGIFTGRFISTGPNQFLVRAPGGMAINTNTPAAGSALTVDEGDVAIINSGRLKFGSTTRQMLNLWGTPNTDYGIGVQTSRMYFRTNSGFSWFEGGFHNNATDNPGPTGTMHMRLSNTGQLQTTTGTISSLSDARLKDQVQDYSQALDQINALRPVRYHYRDAGKAAFQPEGLHLGFLAQEMQQVFPEWVSEGEDGYLMLSMRGFEAVAVRAMQELSAENSALKAQITAQNIRLDALEAKLNE